MKKLFFYTIENSGSRTIGQILRKLYAPEEFQWLGDAHFISRGRENITDYTSCSEINQDWVANNIDAFLTEEEQNKKLLVTHAHHRIPNSQFCLAISKKLALPIVSLMRDPLLIINSWRWRDFISNKHQQDIHAESINQRLQRAHIISDLVRGLLNIQTNGQFFLLSIDQSPLTDPALRLKHLERIIEHCGLVLSKDAEDFISDWNVIGDTSKSYHLREKGFTNEFIAHKEALINNDKKEIRLLMKHELEYLQHQPELKQLMENMGYQNLAWF